MIINEEEKRNNKYINIESVYCSPYVLNLNESDKYSQCAYFIEKSNKIVILSGAGISTSQNIPDFRSKTGWYSKNPQNILSINNFINNPKEVYRFLYKYLNTIKGKTQSKAHSIIKDLEKCKQVYVITQNIDKLHNNNILIEFHGNLESAHCLKCGKKFNIEYILNDDIEDFNRCECGGLIKPDIILFDEDIKSDNILKANNICKEADLIMIIGTSLTVEPFASLPLKAPIETPFIILNKTATYLDDNNMSVVINEDCDKSLSEIYKRFLNKDF
ncbi:SIR2 family NAD-dependent protein deacylase [Clostridium perfringens]|uniref:protein acetyllysine N-acetyltransferase n=1 Tax=Clostridium perfringens TaxID=1502 RepID=A0A140GRJ0_CLOPF|nr:Sir2 family NAD-dependent protein deacetylase [Clostridium perfringens]AMN31149.1 NAD-dependent protein deacetylase of SIR2 family [Clostridium perfringens]